MQRQLFIPVVSPSHLITEIWKRDTVSCNGSLVKVNKKFHHYPIITNLLMVNVLEHQGKYLCLGNDGYPNMIYYVQLSGTLIISMTNIS